MYLRTFQTFFFEIYELYTASFLIAPRLTHEVTFKKANVKWDLLIDINLLLIEEKAFDMEYVMLIINVEKLIRNTWKKNYENIEPSHFKYWNNVAKNTFKWFQVGWRNTSFNENNVMSNKNNDEGYFFEVDI